MPKYTPTTVLASAVYSATTNSNPVAFEYSTNIAVTVTLTAITGGGTVTPSIQWSADGTNWVPEDPATAFTALTAAGGAARNVSVKGPLMRVVLTLSGGTAPTFTASVVTIPLASS